MTISKSGLEMFQKCPRCWYYQRRTDLSRKTDYHRHGGVCVHHHIKTLEVGPDWRRFEGRRFYYLTSRSNIGAWLNRWARSVGEKIKNNEFISIDPEKEKEMAKMGIICVANYWKNAVNIPPPLEVEKTYKLNIGQDINLVGIFDQLRLVSVDYIRNHRPDLIDNGKLIPGYEPTVIVDLKTDKYDFSTEHMKDPTLADMVRKQYELHEYLQPTMYTYLYERITGKKPIGFIWWHLRSGKAFFTFREDKDYQTLFQAIHSHIENIRAELFPKHVGKQCVYCDYLPPCREDRNFILVQPENMADSLSIPNFVPTPFIKDPAKQLKLGPYRIRRMVPGPELPATEKPEKEFRIMNLPWDEKLPEEIEISLEDELRP